MIQKALAASSQHSGAKIYQACKQLIQIRLSSMIAAQLLSKNEPDCQYTQQFANSVLEIKKTSESGCSYTSYLLRQ